LVELEEVFVCAEDVVDFFDGSLFLFGHIFDPRRGFYWMLELKGDIF
jgi:hypothetical protein